MSAENTVPVITPASTAASVRTRQVRIAFSPPLSIVSTRETRSSHNAQDGLVVTHAADEGSARYSAGPRIPSTKSPPDGERPRAPTPPGPEGRPQPGGNGGTPRRGG